MRALNRLRKNKLELVIFLSAILFSSWLMFSTFSYQDGSMQIASKAWSDFASHIPLIRSFTFGDNFPPQYPLFSGPPIRYHFLFYALVGLLEKGGLRIDFALNILSILGFSFLILMIYLFSKEIFKSKAVGLLSILFFIFNGSLAFINFFSKNPLSENTILDIIRSEKFMSFGPYDGGVISAFWNLNIYTNQRHLALSYALSLFIIYLFIKLEKSRKNNFKKSILIGIILGISFLLNMAVFLMTLVVLCGMFIFFEKKRVYLLISMILGLIISIPQFLLIQSSESSFAVTFHPGYLVNNVDLLSFLNYWFQNLGLHILFIPLAFILAKGNARKILLYFLGLFILGNLVQFSPEIAANHKFFNYFMIIGVMFSSYFLVVLWNKKSYLKPFVLIFVFSLIFSGIIDIFPIFNDHKISLSDYPVNKDVSWIMRNTSPDSIFLNTQYLYDNASLAGRKIFLGWPYFAWSQGYDTLTRDNLRKEMLSTNDLKFFCANAIKYNIDYIEVNNSYQEFKVNSTFFKNNFVNIYENEIKAFNIYST